MWSAVASSLGGMKWLCHAIIEGEDLYLLIKAEPFSFQVGRVSLWSIEFLQKNVVQLQV